MAPAPQNIPPAQIPGDESRQHARWVAVILLGLLVAVWIGQGARIASLDTDQLVTWNVVIDDGYYYLQIARNMARGYGSTFDRVNPTNGYQPLWMLSLVPIFWFTNSPEIGLKALLVFATLLGAGAMVLLYFALQRLIGLGTALLACTLVAANPYFLQIMHGGLETPLLFFGLCGLLAFWARQGEAILAGERRPLLIMGLLLSLIILTRLDTVLFLAPMVGMLILWGRGKFRPKVLRGVWLALPLLALVLPYLSWNWISHGSPIPISGQVKSWAVDTNTPTWYLFVATEQWRGLGRTLHALFWPLAVREPHLFRMFGFLAIPGIMIIVLGLRCLWSKRARKNHLAMILLGASTVGLLFHGCYMFFIYRACSHWNYHYFFPLAVFQTTVSVAAVTLLATDLGWVANYLLRRRLQRGFAALGAALCLPLVAYFLDQGFPAADERYYDLEKPLEESFRKARLDGANYIRTHYPPDAVFGAWWSGTVGYFSDRRVINLDGVVNSGAYFREYLKTDTVDQYILNGPILHLADFFWRNPLSPGFTPSPRLFWWEFDKEHLVHRLKSHLSIRQVIPFRGQEGFYIFDIK